MDEDTSRESLATKLRLLGNSMSPLPEYSDTPLLGVPGTVRNMIYGSMQKEDFTSMSKTCTQFYIEVRKLHFDQRVHIIKPSVVENLAGNVWKRGCKWQLARCSTASANETAGH